MCRTDALSAGVIEPSFCIASAVVSTSARIDVVVIFKLCDLKKFATRSPSLASPILSPFQSKNKNPGSL